MYDAATRSVKRCYMDALLGSMDTTQPFKKAKPRDTRPVRMPGLLHGAEAESLRALSFRLQPHDGPKLREHSVRFLGTAVLLVKKEQAVINGYELGILIEHCF